MNVLAQHLRRNQHGAFARYMKATRILDKIEAGTKSIRQTTMLVDDCATQDTFDPICTLSKPTESSMTLSRSTITLVDNSERRTLAPLTMQPLAMSESIA